MIELQLLKNSVAIAEQTKDQFFEKISLEETHFLVKTMKYLLLYINRIIGRTSDFADSFLKTTT